jgi:hypothetical protein
MLVMDSITDDLTSECSYFSAMANCISQALLFYDSVLNILEKNVDVEKHQHKIGKLICVASDVLLHGPSQVQSSAVSLISALCAVSQHVNPACPKLYIGIIALVFEILESNPSDENQALALCSQLFSHANSELLNLITKSLIYRLRVMAVSSLTYNTATMVALSKFVNVVSSKSRDLIIPLLRDILLDTCGNCQVWMIEQRQLCGLCLDMMIRLIKIVCTFSSSFYHVMLQYLSNHADNFQDQYTTHFGSLRGDLFSNSWSWSSDF